jgi:hypothetical protein
MACLSAQNKCRRCSRHGASLTVTEARGPRPEGDPPTRPGRGQPGLSGSGALPEEAYVWAAEGRSIRWPRKAKPARRSSFGSKFPPLPSCQPLFAKILLASSCHRNSLVTSSHNPRHCHRPESRDLSLACRRSLPLPAGVRASRNGGGEHAQPGARPHQLRLRLRRRPPPLPQLHCPRRRRPRPHPKISSLRLLLSPSALVVVG